jgi:hypothetical protein
MESRWIADAGIAGLALWAALGLVGLLAGMFASRWNAAESHVRGGEGMLLAAAAAGVIAWFANAGSLIGGSASNNLLNGHVPIDVEPGYRLAVLWATLPGAALTFAVALLVGASLAARPRGTERSRFIAAVAVIALLALGLTVWFTPSPNATSSRIPAFVQSAPAALAPLFALGALILLVDAGAARAAGASPGRTVFHWAWAFSTLALAAEQMARSRLGIGPRDAILFGSASSGLVLWLLTSALLHRRVQSLVSSMPARSSQPATARAVAAHAGAILLVVSFALHALAARATVALAPGASVSVRDSFHRSWQLANQGVSRFDEEGVDVLSVALEARSPSGQLALLTPEIRDYHGRRGEHLENALSRRKSTGILTQTVRVLLVGADALDVASVRVTFLPVPFLWPVGIALLAVSMLMPRGSGKSPTDPIDA